MANPIVKLETTQGAMTVELYPEIAPNTVANFVNLVESGFYNGTEFYRVEYGFCVSGGLDANGGSTTKWGGSGYPAETTDALHHYSGALCAAMSANGQGGSVFYVMQTLPQAPADELVQAMTDAGWRTGVIDAYKAVGGAPYLDNTDTVFGQVYEGMAVIDAIAEAGRAGQTADSAASEQTAPVVLNRIIVTTYPAE